MIRFLLGRALWRWLERLGEEEPPRPPRVSVEVRPLADAETPTEQPRTGDWVFPRVQGASMGCLFEIYLAGVDREALEGAAHEALEEIERLDRQLSHYRDDSDIARLNAHAADQWVRLEPRLYNLLRRCAALSAATDGAFDISTLPLLRAWGFHDGAHRVPSSEEIASLLPLVGMRNLEFDDEERLVRYCAPGVEVALGAVGKGYAIDEAVTTLRFYRVNRAVIHGGRSTVYAIGAPPDDEAWRFTIKDPRDHRTPLEEIGLRDAALSTSAATEQRFEADGVEFGHILDPRTGHPASRCLSVSVVAPSAELSDALSTAFYVGGPELAERYTREHPEVRAILVLPSDRGVDVRRYGGQAAHADRAQDGVL